MHDVHTEVYKDHTIHIQPDEVNESPRTDYDNLGTMVCFHKRYNLGDTGHGFRFEDYNSWEELETAIRKQEDIAAILPIYIYDHSGLTINTTGFSCPWDSGQIGFVFISKKKIREEYSVKRISPRILKQAINVMQGEVKTYDQYLQGNIYGYIIDGPDGEENIDSCWGFYGEENGSYDYCLEEAKGVIDYMIKKAEEEVKKEIEKNQLQLELSA
jgi:hypothetical protein